MVSPELLAACRQGDPDAFEEVVRRTYRHVYTQALRLVGDRHEAEDVTQDVYLRVFRGLSGFRGESQFETWLYRIVANAAINQLKRRGRFGQLMAEPEPDRGGTGVGAGNFDLPSGEILDEQAADRDALTAALESLPFSLRSVVILKDVYGLSCQEIGEELGTTEGAVKVRLHRARRRLKDLLFDSEG
jgi:RNA polymerase sigma-70 factor, ECF subfamily